MEDWTSNPMNTEIRRGQIGGMIYLVGLGNIHRLFPKVNGDDFFVCVQRSLHDGFRGGLFLLYLSFVAIFAGLGLGSTNADYTEAITLVAGITLGSAFWWLLLNGYIAYEASNRTGEK